MTGQTNIFDEIIVDNFAGGGGASTGIELAEVYKRQGFRILPALWMRRI